MASWLPEEEKETYHCFVETLDGKIWEAHTFVDFDGKYITDFYLIRDCNKWFKEMIFIAQFIPLDKINGAFIGESADGLEHIRAAWIEKW